MVKNHVIGIDLGTTLSAVGVWQNGKVEIIRNEQSRRFTPSCVSFSENRRFVGDDAKYLEHVNVKNTITNFKQLTCKLPCDIQKFPRAYDVVEENGRLSIEVEHQGKLKLTIEEVSAMILSKMKDIAEAYVGAVVTDAVISVPAHYSNSQRLATLDAAEIAGLTVLRLVNEPTAAAIAFGAKTNIGIRKALIYDLGGGSLDVSVVKIMAGTDIEVLATAGDPALGGDDFTNCLVEFLAGKFLQETGVSISGDERAISRLKHAAEEAKKSLSVKNIARIHVSTLKAGLDFETSVTREEFEAAIAGLVSRVLVPVEKILKAVGNVEDVTDIVLIGGSCRVPIVQARLQDFFKERHLNLSFLQEETVAHGATILAASLSGSDPLKYRDIIPYNVAHEEEGSEVLGTLVPQCAPAPSRKIIDISAIPLNEENFITLIEETGRNKGIVLGNFKPRSGKITVDVDDSGVFSVLPWTGVENYYPRLTEEQVATMKTSTLKFKEEDRIEEERLVVRNELERFAFRLKQKLYKVETVGDLERDLMEDLRQTMDWLENNPTETASAYNDKKNELAMKVQDYEQGIRRAPAEVEVKIDVHSIEVNKKPQEIVSFIEGELSFNLNCLEKIIENIRDLPIAVYSVNGLAREEKTKLLNVIKTYLLEKCYDQDQSMDDPCWMADESRLLKGVCFENNDAKHGIFMWPEPLIVDKHGLGKFAVLLLETQARPGCEDVELRILYGLSLIMSSHGTYIIEKGSNTNSIQEFLTTVKLTNAAIVGVKSKKPFQKALFYLERPQDYESEQFPFGMDGGEEYYKNVINHGDNELTGFFNEVKSVLMPGLDETEYMETLENLVSYILNPNEIVEDQSCLSGEELLNKFERCTSDLRHVLKSAGSLQKTEEVKTMELYEEVIKMDRKALDYYYAEKEKSLALFRSAMEDALRGVIYRTCHSLNISALAAIHGAEESFENARRADARYNFMKELVFAELKKDLRKLWKYYFDKNISATEPWEKLLGQIIPILQAAVIITKLARDHSLQLEDDEDFIYLNNWFPRKTNPLYQIPSVSMAIDLVITATCSGKSKGIELLNLLPNIILDLQAEEPEFIKHLLPLVPTAAAEFEDDSGTKSNRFTDKVCEVMARLSVGDGQSASFVRTLPLVVAEIRDSLPMALAALVVDDHPKAALGLVKRTAKFLRAKLNDLTH